MRQRREPGYYLKRELPPTARPYRESLHAAVPERAHGMSDDLTDALDRRLRRRRHREEDVVRWDHDDRSFAIYHGADGAFYCTDGFCTHERLTSRTAW